MHVNLKRKKKTKIKGLNHMIKKRAWQICNWKKKNQSISLLIDVYICLLSPQCCMEEWLYSCVSIMPYVFCFLFVLVCNKVYFYCMCVGTLTQSLGSTRAPASRSSLTMSRCPNRAAKASGVHPSASAEFASACAPSSSRTAAVRPFSQAHISAVVPFYTRK